MNYELYLIHHGIKGQRWGIRRFQNKNGSLTRLGKKRVKEADETKEETTEERRARTLKSTDAGEIYKNRDLLSTAEINERLTRIDTEARLGRVAESTKQTGMDKVNSVIKVAKKANEIYELTNTPLGKAIKKQLGGKVDENLSPDLRKVWNNIGKMTDDQLTKTLKRANTEKAIKRMLDEYEASKKQPKTPTEKTGSDASSKKDNSPNAGKKTDTETFTGSVEGEGTSRSSKANQKSGPTVDAKEGRDYWNSNDDIRDTKMSDAGEATATGKSIVNELLEDERGGS